MPVVGDWTGDGITKIGVVHPRPAKTDKPVASNTGVSPVASRTGVSPVEQSGTGVPAVPVGSTNAMPDPVDAPSPAPSADTAPPSGDDAAAPGDIAD